MMEPTRRIWRRFPVAASTDSNPFRTRSGDSRNGPARSRTSTATPIALGQNDGEVEMFVSSGKNDASSSLQKPKDIES